MTPAFADLSEARSLPRWSDLSVRDLALADLPRCASLLAAREGWTLARASATTQRWLGTEDARPVVLVAERQGVVQGYGRADHLDPIASGGSAPRGWYLTGLLVAPDARRRGVGDSITRERLGRLAAVTHEVFFFTNMRNVVSIALHERLGFHFQTEQFRISGVTFSGGRGGLYRKSLGTDDVTARS